MMILQILIDLLSLNFFLADKCPFPLNSWLRKDLRLYGEDRVFAAVEKKLLGKVRISLQNIDSSTKYGVTHELNSSKQSIKYEYTSCD